MSEPLMEGKPVSPLYVPATLMQTLMRDFMRPTDDDPSAFVTLQIFEAGDGHWRMSYDPQCDLTASDRVGFDDLVHTFWATQSHAVEWIDMAMKNTGWTASGNWRVRPVPAGQLPSPDLTVPVATSAAAERRDLATERIARVNPHLARMATEIQEMMLWDQYANGALNALIQVYALDLDEGSVVSKACKYADAMMEARLARARKKPAQATVESPEESAEESPT